MNPIGRVDGFSTSSTTAVTPVPASIREQSRELVRAVQSLNKSEFPLFGAENETRVSIDSVTRETVVKVVNKETGETIMQIPPKLALELAKDAKLKSEE